MSGKVRVKNFPPRFPARVAAAVALLFFCAGLCALPASAQKRDKNRPTTGRIEVSTTPGGHQILINGNPAGTTTEYARAIELPPGPHTVEILFPNENRWAHTFNIVAGRRECIALNYRPRTISLPAALASPCPYPVNVSAPATVNDGDIVTFTADVAYAGQSALNYTWTVSPPAARITGGAGTPTITVDTTGLGRRRVTAILVADDGSGDRNCRQTAQASTSVLSPELPRNTSTRFDEFPSTNFNDDKARLDNLAIELQNNPAARAHVIVYAGQGTRPGTAERFSERALNYLTTTRGIDASRVTFVNGGYRERNTYEMWLVPPGADSPQPTPMSAGGGSYAPRRRYRR